MSRWISSAACTLALVAVLFFLPVWGVRSSSSTAASIVSDTAVSNVRIVKRSPKPVPVQPAVQNKNAPSIPIKPAQTLPAPEQLPPEAQTEPEETEASEEVFADSAAQSSSSDSQNAGEDSLSHTNDAKANATYKSYVLGRIASKKTYPYAARSNGFEGKVRVRIVINPDGTLAQAVILEPSEYEILNNACLAAVKKASPFKKMSNGMKAMTLSFVMDFSLK
ncbi:energy transducer TonB [Treponema lecithinolyticum]|uniref:TonB-dependent receptor n=1 Tax=Treponema lecithinolyticum ATCC 700332 TaxID=1321815 RepID=A0ABN0P1G1_TRELE|nr:energy transducer TonB [Treponema lecithinolyticum]ERJ94209.1 TonB-dependent receptor [Treponema lecithinolyticum ATCC 700332]